MAFFTSGSEALGPEVKEGLGGELDPKELCNSNNSNNSNNSSNINTVSTSKAKIMKKKKQPEPCASEEHFKASPTVVIDRDGKQYVVPCPPDKADMEPSVVAFVERFVNDIPVILELELVLPRVGKAVAQQTQYMKSLTREEQIDTLAIYLESMPSLSHTDEFIKFISPTRRDFSFPVYARRIKEGQNKVRDVAEVLVRLFQKDDTTLAKFFLDESVCHQILEAGEYSEGQIDFPALVNEYHRIILAITPVEHNSLLVAITERLCMLGAHQRVPIIESLLKLFYCSDEVRFFFGRDCWDKEQHVSELRRFIQSHPKESHFKKFATDIASRFKRDTTVLIKIFSEKL
jgi:hypothetical protein